MRQEETRLQKQLRKAVQSFREQNYFKAICCYSKVGNFLINIFEYGLFLPLALENSHPVASN